MLDQASESSSRNFNDGRMLKLILQEASDALLLFCIHSWLVCVVWYFFGLCDIFLDGSYWKEWYSGCLETQWLNASILKIYVVFKKAAGVRFSAAAHRKYLTMQGSALPRPLCWKFACTVRRSDIFRMPPPWLSSPKDRIWKLWMVSKTLLLN